MEKEPMEKQAGCRQHLDQEDQRDWESAVGSTVCLSSSYIPGKDV